MENKFNLTKNREKVYNIIKEEKTPITAEDIYEKLKSEKIDLSTVYRALAVFCENDIVDKDLRSDKKCYYSIKDEHHGHYIVCNKCNKSIKLKECPIDESLKNELNDLGFEMKTHSIQIEGICKDCKDKK